MYQFAQKKSLVVVIAAALLVLSITTVTGYAQSEAVGDRVVRGTQGMVATAHPLASEAAIEMLKQGGNAVDAAVAAAFTVGVVEPDGSGIGGGGGMVIYLNDTKESHYISYYHRAPGNIGQIQFDSQADRHTAKAVLVPGTVAGLVEALERFGSLPLAAVLEPAIRYARDGFEIDNTLATLILDNTDWMVEMGVTAEVFLDDGFPMMEGDLLQQPELAETLTLIAQNGREGFYGGPVADAMAEQMQAGGGVLSLDDLKNYEVVHSQPLEGDYRGFKVLSADAPQSGSTVIQALNMLENADLQSMGHFSESALTLHLMTETFRRAYADRWGFMGDPAMSYVPIRGLISKRHARERFAGINRYQAEPANYRLTGLGNPVKFDKAGDMSEAVGPNASKTEDKWGDGDDDGHSSYDSWGEDLFDSYGARKKKVKRPHKDGEAASDSASEDFDDFEDEEEFDGHTTHLSVIDKDGNAVALTQTLGTFFGSGQMVKGILLNCGMTNYSKTADVNLVRANGVPRSSIAPTIVLRNDEPFIVVGSPGASRIICTVIELLVDIIDFKMDILQANTAPRFYCQKFADYLHLEAGIKPEVQTKLKNMGHTVRSYETLDLFFGGAQLIMVDTTSGMYYGSADPRRGGVAIGY